MTVRTICYHLRAMEHCTCRIDAHCLKELNTLQWGLRSNALTKLQVLRRLRMMQRCPCYFASHCIETLCELVDNLCAALLAERAARKRTREAASA